MADDVRVVRHQRIEDRIVAVVGGAFGRRHRGAKAEAVQVEHLDGVAARVEAGDRAGCQRTGIAVVARVGDHDGGVHGQTCSGPPTAEAAP